MSPTFSFVLHLGVDILAQIGSFALEHLHHLVGLNFILVLAFVILKQK